MKQLLTFLISLFASSTFSQTFSFTHNSIVRSYIVHLPTGYSASNQYPVIINMHGYTSTASQQQSYSQMNTVADTGKFIVVYPDGVNNAWNAGYGVNPTIDDVDFVSVLIDTMKNKFSVNANKIYACGMSNGGFMSYRLACELNNKIAAIASVTGLMGDSVRLFLCQNSCSVPVMDFHGTADPTVNYNGALGYISADSCIQWWRIKDGCPATPVVTNMPDINTADGATATKYYYGLGNDSSEVIFFKITGGGHTWPGGVSIPSLGNTCQDIKASGEIWNFFRRHSLKCGANGVEDSNYSEEISVYPNPTEGKFQIVSAKFRVSRIEIYNVLGEQLFSSSEKDVDISNLNRGVYFAKVKTEKGIIIHRIVKQ